jgi:hypothetical protein
MYHFYGIVAGSAATKATRRGSRTSGLTTRALTRDGEICVDLIHDEHRGKDKYIITLEYKNKSAIKSIKIAEGYF